MDYYFTTLLDYGHLERSMFKECVELLYVLSEKYHIDYKTLTKDDGLRFDKFINDENKYMYLVKGLTCIDIQIELEFKKNNIWIAKVKYNVFHQLINKKVK